MASCRKVTIKERLAATEREAGRKLTDAERIGLELIPTQYTCTGPGVAGTKPKPKKPR